MLELTVLFEIDLPVMCTFKHHMLPQRPLSKWHFPRPLLIFSMNKESTFILPSIIFCCLLFVPAAQTHNLGAI